MRRLDRVCAEVAQRPRRVRGDADLQRGLMMASQMLAQLKGGGRFGDRRGECVLEQKNVLQHQAIGVQKSGLVKKK